MKKILFILAVVGAMLLATACASGETMQNEPNSSISQIVANGLPQTESLAQYKALTAADAKQRIDSGDELIILDVRTQQEFDERHIENAILIPNETITDTPPQALPDMDAEILVYCRSGNRSRQAAEKLIAMGYTNVYDFGGINDWPYATVSEN